MSMQNESRRSFVARHHCALRLCRRGLTFDSNVQEKGEEHEKTIAMVSFCACKAGTDVDGRKLGGLKPVASPFAWEAKNWDRGGASEETKIKVGHGPTCSESSCPVNACSKRAEKRALPFWCRLRPGAPL